MVKFLKDGVEVDSVALLKIEAARARYMMSLLMRKLGPKGMSEIFADEIAAHAADEMKWHKQSNGKLAGSVAHADVAEGSAQDFIDWFWAGYGGPNVPAMLRSHPEHLGGIPQPDGRLVVFEVPGHSRNPAHLYLRPTKDWSGVPVPLDPQMPHRIMARLESREGELIGAILHEFAEKSPGFKARFSVHWPAATPNELLRGHIDHLMIEWNNWIRMYLQTRSQNVDLMPIALKCGL